MSLFVKRDNKQQTLHKLGWVPIKCERCCGILLQYHGCCVLLTLDMILKTNLNDDLISCVMDHGNCLVFGVFLDGPLSRLFIK